MATLEVKPKEHFYKKQNKNTYLLVVGGSQDLHDLADERTSYQHEY